MKHYKASFPIEMWIDDYLWDHYKVSISWDKIELVEDDAEAEVTFDEDSITGSRMAIENFFTDFDPEEVA